MMRTDFRAVPKKSGINGRTLGWDILSYTIHGTGIFTYIYHKNQPNVGKYTSPMDGMGMICPVDV